MKAKKQVGGSEGKNEPVTRRSSRGRKLLSVDAPSEEIIPASPSVESSGRKRRRSEASPVSSKPSSSKRRAKDKADDVSSEKSIDDNSDMSLHDNNITVSPSKAKISSLPPLQEDMEIVPQRDAITDSATNEVAPIILSVQEPDSADIKEMSDSAPLPDTKTPTEEKEPAIAAPETTEPVKTVAASAPIDVTPPLIRQSTVPSSYSAASIHSQLSAAIGSAQQISTKTVTPSTSLGLIGANSMSAVTNPVANRPPPAVVSIPPPQARRPTSTSPPATPPLLNIPSSNASASLSGDTPLISSIATSMSPSIALLSSTLSSQNDFSYSGIPASPPLQSPRPVTGAPPPPLLPTRSSSESQISLPRYPSAPHNLSSTATPRSNSMTSSMSTSSLLSSSLWPGSTAPDATYLTHKSVPDRSAFTHVTSNPSFTAAAQSKSTASDAKSESSSKNNKDRLLTKSLSASNISSSFQGDVGGQLMLSSLGNVRGQARTQSISSARSAAQSPLPVNSTNAPEGKKSSNTPIQSTPRQSPSSNKERGDESVPVLHRRREIATTKLLAMERKSLLSRQGAPFVAPRLKSHWDYMMEEMQWLTIDFRQERRWAKSHCKTKAAMCANFLSLKNLNDNNGQWKDSMIYPPPTPSIQYEYWVQHLERCRDTSATVESRRVSSQLAFLVQEFWSVNTELAHTIDAAPLSMSELPKPINRTVEEFNKLVLETKENLMTICKPALEVSKLISPRLELTHGQLNALASCVAITARGYGVALRGESSSGKTVVAVALLRCWLQENAEPLLLITVKSRAHRWKYEFERVNDDNDIVIFSVHGCPRPHARVVVIYAEDLASTHGQIVKQFIDSRNWGGVMIDMRIHSRHSMITDNLFSVFHDISAAVTRCSGRRAVLWYKHAAMAGISVELLRFLLPSVFTSVQLVDKWKVWYTREHSGARTADAIIMEDLLANLYVVLGKVLVPLTPGTNKESERKAPTHSVCTKRYDVDASKVDLTPDQRRKYCSVVSMCAPWLCGDNMMLFVQAVMLLQRVCFHSDMLHVSYTSDSDDNRASPTNLYPSFSGDPIGTPREYMQLAMDVRSSPTAVSPGIVSHRLTAGASIESMSPGQEMKSPKLEALVDMIRNAKKSRIIVLADTLEQQLLAHQYLSKSNIEHLHGGIDTTLEDSWAYFYASEQAVIEFNRLVESGAHNEKSTQVIVLSEKYYEFERSSSISPINVDLIIVLSQNWLIQPELEPFMFDTRNEELRVTKVVYIVSRNSFEEVIFHAEKALIKFYNSLCCMDEKNVALSPLAILQGKALSELQLSMHMSRTANFQSLFLGSISSLCPSLCPMLKELFRSNDAYTSSDSSPSDSTLGSNLLLGKGRGKGALTRAPDGSVVAAPTSPPVDTNLRWLQRACVALELSCYMFSNMWGYTLHPHDAPPFTSYQEGKNSSVSPPPTQSLGVLFIGPSVALPADDSSLLLANYFKPTLEYQRLVSLHLEKQDPVVTADDDLLHKLFWNFHKKLSASRRSFTLCDNLDIGLLGYLANTVYETQENAVNNFENASVKPRTVYEDAVDMLYAPNVEGIDIASRHHDIVTQLQRTGDQVDRNLLVSPLSVASGQDVLTMPSWMTKSSSMETIFSIKYNTKSTKSKKQKQPKSEPKRKSTVTSNELHVTAVHLNSILPGDRFKAQMQQGTVRNDISAVNPYETKLYERPRPRGLSVAHVEYPPGLILNNVEKAILRRISALYPSTNAWFQQESVNEGNAPLSLGHVRSSQQLRRANIDVSATDDHDSQAQNISPPMNARIAEVLQLTDHIRKRRTRGRSIDILGTGDADTPDSNPDDLLLQNPNLLAECHVSHRSVVQNAFANAALNAVQVFDKLHGKVYPSRGESFNNPPTSSNQLLLQQLTSASNSKPVMSDRTFSSPPLLQGQHPAFSSAAIPTLPPASKAVDDLNAQASKQQQLLLSHPLLQSPLLGEEYAKKLEHIITTRHVPEFETKLLKTLYSQESPDQQKIVLLKALLSKSV